MSTDPLDSIFKEVISSAKKERLLSNDERERTPNSAWGFTSSSDHPTDSSILEGKIEGNEAEPINPGSQDVSGIPTTPVGIFDFGESYKPTFDLNFEFDESPVGSENNSTTGGVKFPTYKETRSFRADVISYVERYYFEHADLPPHNLLHSTFKDYPEAPRYVKQWKELLENLKNTDGHSIQDQLEFRGLPTYRTGDDYLEPAFISACHLILNPHDRRSDAAKLKDVGISSAKWNAYLKRRPYRIYYQRHADKIFDEETQVEAKRSLDRLVRKDDLSAIKYVDERTGIYRSSTQNIEIVGMFMQAIFSILARNVPSNVINIIQAEIREEPIMKKFLADAIEIQEAKAG